MEAICISIIIVINNDSHLCDYTTVINYGSYIYYFSGRAIS